MLLSTYVAAMTVKICALAYFTIFVSINISYVRADAGFHDVRTELAKSHAGKEGDPEDKYFRV